MSIPRTAAAFSFSMEGRSASQNILDRAQPGLANSSTQTLLQTKVDQGVQNFVRHATDWKGLAAMVAGGTGYRFGRVAVMGRGLRTVNHAVTRSISVLAGLTAEVSAFELTHRTLLSNSESEIPHLWRWNGPGGLGQGFLQSFITFGTMKGMGRLAQGQNFIVQHAAQDLSMVLGHQWVYRMGGAKPEGAFFEQMLHAEATNLQIGAGMSLLRQTVPSLHALERGLDLNLQGRAPGRPENKTGLPVGERAFAGASGEFFPSRYFSEAWREKPAPLQMAGKIKAAVKSEEDLLAQAGPELQKRAEELAKKEGERPEDFVRQMAEELREVAKKDRSRLLPEEKKFLLSVADFELNRFKTLGPYYLALRIYRDLHHFTGLRRLMRALEKDNTDRREILMLLENYEEAFRLFDLAVKKVYKCMPDLNVLFQDETSQVHQHLRKFGEKKGYDHWNSYSLDEAMSALTRLSGQYDLVIPIARGGLFSGAVAEFLGLPVRVIEVHAHSWESPTSRFIDEIRPEEVKGKRILFVDKDTVTGASLRQAVKLIAPWQPRAVGAFFNYEVGHIIPKGTAEELKREGIALHFPDKVRPVPTLPLFYKIHENMNTTLGRFRKVIGRLEDLIPSLEEKSPEAQSLIQRYIERQKGVFFAFNPLLEGVDRIRETMVSRLEGLVGSFIQSRAFDERQALANLLYLMNSDSPLPINFASELAQGRYHERGLQAAYARGIQNIHFPHSYAASFRSAQGALKDRYDVALIVGPEGFTYEPIFTDLGMKTVAVNIPEANFGGRRSIAVLGDLSILTGKRVLVVEDDVQSGATLKKLLEELRFYPPRFLGLYLGLPALRQMAENIPPEFKKVYVTELDPEKDDAAFLKHLKKRETVFKQKPPPLRKP